MITPMLLDHPLIASRYFFPSPEPIPDPFWVEGPAGRLACHYTHVSDPARTLIYFHGNGEVVADYVPYLVEHFVGLGVNVLLAEYRGYGGSDGEPRLVSMLDDVVPIFEALGRDADEVVVFGRSVGSIYAIELVHRIPEIAALVLDSGIADPFERVLLRVDPSELGTTREILAEEAAQVLDHRRKLAGFGGRLLVMHARHDHLIDPSHAQRNHDWAGSEHKRLVIFERGDHNSILMQNQGAYFEELARFLDGM